MSLVLFLGCSPDAAPDADGDGFAVSADCDDGDPGVYPGAPERCDGRANDCDNPDAPEVGLVSFENGGWSDLTPEWAVGAVGTPESPAILPLPDSGVVHVCPGTWYLHLVVSDGAIELRGEGPAETIVLDASGVGSVIVGSEADLTLTGVTLTGGIGSGDVSTQGGAVYQTGGALTLDRVIVRDNVATDSGGGVYAWGSTVTLVDSEFTGNQAGESGGGVYVTDTSSTGYVQRVSTSVSGCSFLENTAGSDGGGLAFQADDPETASSLVVEAGDFVDNQSDAGGGLSVSGEGIELTIGSDARFDGNGATDAGGGAYIAASGFGDVQALFTDNSAFRGGGLFTHSADVSIRDATFERNDAGTGGAMQAQCGDAGGIVRIEDAVMAENTASSRGGALHALVCEVVVVRSVLASNRSEIFGGALDASEATVTFTGVTLEGNEATIGGAARLSGSVLQCEDGGSFHGNTASERGGAVYFADSEMISDGCGFGEPATSEDNTGAGQPDDVLGVSFASAVTFGEDAWFTCDDDGCR